MWIVWDPVEGVLGYILYLKIVAAGRKKRSYFDFWDLIENLEQNVMFGKKKTFFACCISRLMFFDFSYYSHELATCQIDEGGDFSSSNKKKKTILKGEFTFFNIYMFFGSPT